jgi:pteridine reductase
MSDTPQFLAGSVALITGAGQRLGRATAESLAAHGADVVIHYFRSADAAVAAVAAIEKLGRRGWMVRADLDQPDQAQTVVSQASQACGRAIDILVNSASYFESNRITEVTPEDIQANIRVHALAPLLLSRGLAAQGAGGRIINMLDTRIVDYDRDHAAYHLSKRMLFTLTRMLAVELAPRITVNAVAPGAILPAPGASREQFEQLAQAAPLGRVGEPQDVIKAILFLLDSPFITGQVIFVDGGRHMRGNMYG